MHTARNRDPRPATTAEPTAASPRTAAIVVAGAAAAWIAAGSLGAMADPLRHVLTWLALGTAVVIDWPPSERSARDWLMLAGAGVAAAAMTAAADPVVNVLAVALLLAALVRSPQTPRGRAVLLAAAAVAVLAVYRAAYASIPAVWFAANGLGAALGSAAGAVADRPLSVGATFGGVDFLVFLAAWYAGWLAWTRPPRAPRAITAAAAILLVQFVYLVVLSLGGDLLAALPAVRPPDIPDLGANHVGTSTWSAAAASLIPWNLPALAALLHAAVLAAMVRWAEWSPAPPPAPTAANHRQPDLAGRELAADLVEKFGPVLLAGLLPVLTVLALTPTNLDDARVVVYDPGDVDWGKPQFDAATDGSYGLLPDLVESLGGTLVRSADLAADDLAAADVVLLLHPAKPLPDERLARLLRWVREEGGSLLAVPDPQAFGRPPDAGLAPVVRAASIRLRNDTAVPAAPRWDAPLGTVRHPATIGLGDRRNRLGLFVGSTLSTRLSARPIAAARFALGEPGTHAQRTGRALYDAGEPLGDLVLAAEQPLGRGRIAVLGSNAALHNEMIARSYPFVARLLADARSKAAGPRALWRQIAGLLAAVGLVVLLAWRSNALKVASTAVTLAVAWGACVAASDAAARVLPEGTAADPHPIAYIDAAHLGAYSSDASHDLGLNGLERTLVRAGYLPLYLPELTAERLERAAVLVSIAPARGFSGDERELVSSFVRDGGLLIAMAGAEHARATNGLVEQFGFRVPPSPVGPEVLSPEPRPEGVLYSRYLVLDDYEPAMWHHAAWPVESTESRADVLKRDLAGNATIVARAVGDGAVIVIGDTYFATNQNLEWGPRGPTDENMVFWRWMISRVVGPTPWTPPKPATEQPPDADPPTEEQPPVEELPGAEPAVDAPGNAAPPEAEGADDSLPAGVDAPGPQPPPGGGLPVDEAPAAMPSPEGRP